MFNMKDITATDAFLDILVPVVFTLSLYYFSQFIERLINEKVKKIVISISKAGLVCIFVHMAIIAVFKNIGIIFNELNIWFYALLIYIISWGLYLILSRFKASSFLFCGTIKK